MYIILCNIIINNIKMYMNIYVYTGCLETKREIFEQVEHVKLSKKTLNHFTEFPIVKLLIRLINYRRLPHQRARQDRTASARRWPAWGQLDRSSPLLGTHSGAISNSRWEKVKRRKFINTYFVAWKLFKKVYRTWQQC